MSHIIRYDHYIGLSFACLILVFSACSGGGSDDDDSGPQLDDDSVADDASDDSAADDSVADDDVTDDASDDEDDSSDDTVPIDDSGSDDDSADDTADDAADDSADDDTQAVLHLDSVNPASGGASVFTPVTLTGEAFEAGMTVSVGGIDAQSVHVVSSTSATAVFPSVPLTDLGLKDVTVTIGAESDTLAGGFEYLLDEDPIVFVHGFTGHASDFNKMKERFRAIGYPDDYLNAIQFNDTYGSNRDAAQDELPPFVDEVLSRTGAEKVDVIAHSMGGLSSRLWIAQYGGDDKVRDYVSLSGTQHGNYSACLTYWWESAQELCPAYADDGSSTNDVQWDLNGDPDSSDVDETPFGVEDGGDIYWHAMYAGLDAIVIPNSSGCLNQSSADDCSDPVNQFVPGLGHMEMIYDAGVFSNVAAFVRAHNSSKP